MNKEKIYIVMPAYNEAENIKSVLEQWYPVIERLNAEGSEARIVIANDGSKDDTWNIMSRLADKYKLFTPIDKPNSGHGGTVMYLYRHAIDNGCHYIFQTDSDGQTNPDEFYDFWQRRTDYDMIIGHRSNRQDGISRIVVTKVLKMVVRMTFGVSVTDANTPFRLMKTSSISPILNIIPSDFFLSNVALSALAIKKGLKCAWTPITFKPRQGGVNSINLKRISRIGWKAIGDFYRINKSVKKS